MKNAIFLTLLSWLVLIGCNSNSQSERVKNRVEQAQKTTTAKAPETDKGKSNYTPLTKQQATDFFPKQLGDYKLFHIEVNLLKTNGMAAGTYVKGTDYDHTLTYSLQDGKMKGSAILRNFGSSYSSDLKGPQGTSYEKQERDGYKTIAFLQPAINQYEITFVYKNRFQLALLGAERPDALWKYVNENDLQKLDSYE
ncbi:MAG: hypothetical protein ACK5M7_18000 [Draconibacterium sp.]